MDKYERVTKIGEGLFGKAFLVKAKKDGHQYVIKEVSISGMSDKERQESRKEIAVLANMNHPNIVQYKESFEESGCLYIVMDYCEGGDLFKKINSQRGMYFSEEQILDWFVQICLALKHIHDRKILHRDIKSQNIFLTKDGTVQLGDFGIARVLNSTLELARTCIGTPYYLSPEICENKPYNNKSDVWALGCVLYEMCTLKHAFEAGNMKNLVLKIIRGSYHPVSLHYSQELHSLLAQLFKHNPRERPSVSCILDKPFLSCRIQRFLKPQEIAQEFHHRFIYKQHKVGAHQGSLGKITTPACKYGVPLTATKVSVTKKTADRKPAVKQKPAPGSIHRRVNQGEEELRIQEVIKKRRMDLIDKEKQHKEQISRINHAREQGWKNVLISSNGSPERKCYLGGGRRATAVGPSPVPSSTPACVLRRNPCEKYHIALDQMEKQQSNEMGIRKGGSAVPGTPIRNVAAAPGPVHPNGPSPLMNPDAVKRELLRLQHLSKQPHMSRQKTRIHIDRAYHVEEFLQRKREAMLNKVRAEGQLGNRQNREAIYGGQVGSARFTSKVNKKEEEYLTRLRQIRLQNFNERQQIKARLRGEKIESDGSESQESNEEAELRRKKIEALKAQAHARAALLKEQLEKKRLEANEREKMAWDDHVAAQEKRICVAALSTTSQPTTVKTSALPESEPTTPLISMTVALKNIGAITPLKQNLPVTEAVVVIQSEKKQILNRLNQDRKAQSPGNDPLESTATSPKEQKSASQQILPDTEKLPSIKERNKLHQVELPVCHTSQPTMEEVNATASNRPSGADRKKWEERLPFVLSVAQQTLEDTCIQTAQQTLEDTCIQTIEPTAGEVMQTCVLQGEGQRKVWEVSPDCQILKVLHEAAVQPLTQLLETVTFCEEAFPSSDKPNQTVTQHAMSTPEEYSTSKDSTSSIVEVKVQTKYVATTKASHPENVLEKAGNTRPSTATEIQYPEDVESLMLEDVPKASHSSVSLHHEWEKQDQQPMLPEVSSNQEAAAAVKKEVLSQDEERLFMKLCSPAHKRTSALVRLSAQSSMDESSSLTSRSRSVSPLRSKHQNSLLIGLSTGLFDANNPKMLRTCSLPDLSQVFSSEDFVITTEDNTTRDGNLKNEDLNKPDEQSETEDAYEDEDLREIRASMERLLQEESDLMQNITHYGRGDFKGNSTVGDEKDLFNRLIGKLEQDNNQMVEGGGGDDDNDDDVDDDGDDDDDDDDNEADEEDAECLNGSPSDEEAREPLSNGVEEESHVNKSHFNEEWHSDNTEEDQEGETELYDSIYSRLEEHRFNLEQQMGFEKFLEAYNKIKAIRDDEDDNIDLGSSLALSILGTEHQHLYPNILHLVMADSAYQEGAVGFPGWTETVYNWAIVLSW
ncbi:serine/threonine-protein kinase Nek1 isoform X4 [Syngnathoides biaculeatus]|uniref:serine/threonine-protein kinase Nek1 isoform X4 n=2 Tax=Syngnathoides biaculeatus TaxID=300417 RepID=UPI002ADE6827|nr:serine/threonine-protein kinase Nek1 isoform X4 [Syngnathoides biaculeatus]